MRMNDMKPRYTGRLFLRTLLLALALVAAVGGAGSLARASAQRPNDPPHVELSLMPAAQSIDPGQPVNVDVVINSAVAVRSVQFSLRFNPAVLQASGFDAGPFFKTWADANGGTALVFPSPAPIDNVAGKAGVVSINILGGGAGGPMGTGVIGTFHLSVKSGTAGMQSSLSLEDVVVGDSELNAVTDVALHSASVQASGGAVTPTPTESAAGHVELSLMPATQSADPGQSVNVNVVVNTNVPLRSVQFSLHFNPAVLQASGFDAGPFFKSWADAHGGSALVFPDPAPIDNVTGKVGVVSINILGGEASGPSGTGVVGTFHLSVKPGTAGMRSDLSMADVVVGDADLNAVNDVVLRTAEVQVAGVVPTPTNTPRPGPSATPTHSATATSTTGHYMIYLPVAKKKN
jgi:hypothetical protein